jgi:glucosamine 6-phosphate synthetase-like amidotransferase/phosphosugar isomerase protein
MPLVVGVGEGENFLASDAIALNELLLARASRETR